MLDTLDLTAKIASAKRLILDAIGEHQPDFLYIGHSGGKDSCVIHHLVKTTSVCTIQLVHNPKPTTHPDTYSFIQNLATTTPVHFIDVDCMPGFLHEHGFTAQIDGTREYECTRTDKSSTHIVDGVHVTRKGMQSVVTKGIFGLTLYYPIYNWTDEEVFAYINQNNIQLSKEYNSLLVGGEYFC